MEDLTMTNQSVKVDKVTDVIKVLRAGVDFYGEASKAISDLEVKRFFTQMIETRQMAVNELQPFAVLEKGEIETGESIAVNIRKAYTKIKATMTSDTDHTYIDQLEEVEDKTLASLDDAIKASEGFDCHNALLKVRLVMQKCHDDMKALQIATS